MKREFNDEQIMGLGRMVAQLFGMHEEGDDLIAKMAEEHGVSVEEVKEAISVDEASLTFTMKDDGVDYKLTLAVAKTEEEEALEGMPAGTEYLGGGLYAVPDPVDEDDLDEEPEA